METAIDLSLKTMAKEEEENANRFSGDPNPSNLSKSNKCTVCGQQSEKHHIHYGALACFSCRAFFRRAHEKSRTPVFVCKKDNKCNISGNDRRKCGSCRYKYCIKAGMNPKWVLTEEQKKRRFRKFLDRKANAEMLEITPIKLKFKKNSKKDNPVVHGSKIVENNTSPKIRHLVKKTGNPHLNNNGYHGNFQINPSGTQPFPAVIQGYNRFSIPLQGAYSDQNMYYKSGFKPTPMYISRCHSRNQKNTAELLFTMYRNACISIPMNQDFMLKLVSFHHAADEENNTFNIQEVGRFQHTIIERIWRIITLKYTNANIAFDEHVRHSSLLRLNAPLFVQLLICKYIGSAQTMGYIDGGGIHQIRMLLGQDMPESFRHLSLKCITLENFRRCLGRNKTNGENNLHLNVYVESLKHCLQLISSNVPHELYLHTILYWNPSSNKGSKEPQLENLKDCGLEMTLSKVTALMSQLYVMSHIFQLQIEFVDHISQKRTFDDASLFKLYHLLITDFGPQEPQERSHLFLRAVDEHLQIYFEKLIRIHCNLFNITEYKADSLISINIPIAKCLYLIKLNSEKTFERQFSLIFGHKCFFRSNIDFQKIDIFKYKKDSSHFLYARTKNCFENNLRELTKFIKNDSAFAIATFMCLFQGEKCFTYENITGPQWTKENLHEFLGNLLDTVTEKESLMSKNDEDLELKHIRKNFLALARETADIVLGFLAFK